VVCLEDEKKMMQQAGWRMKAVSDEVELLNRQKQFITIDNEAVISRMMNVQLHNLTYIAKSNSLRRAAKDTDAELKSVCEQLEASRLRLRDCLIIDGE